jgi:3-dehydroquinate dehydratase-2
MNILVLNGPNLNLIGTREPEIYGTKTYRDLQKYINNCKTEFEVDITMYQSNHEGVLIDHLHKASEEKYDAILLNAGAYTHYSYALYDAIKAIDIPVYEVHLSDPEKRESFRQTSVIKDACIKTFKGRHFVSYKDAIAYIKKGH